MINTIVFWLERHPRSIAGTIKFLSNKYNVICVCKEKGIVDSRKKMGWECDDLGLTKLIYLSEEQDYSTIVNSIIGLPHKSTFHFIMGFKNKGINKIVYKYIIGKNSNIAVIAERPTAYNLNVFKKIYSYILYKYFAFRLRHKIKLILAMGTMGVDAYINIGFLNTQVMPYMYHKVTKLTQSTNNTTIPETESIKILYVGQLDTRKGTNIIINAFNSIENDGKWSLDIVGANGDMETQAINWAQCTKNVNYLGVWPSIEVSSRTSQYDVCLVPSLYDGWGMFVTEAIEAGVGCITTDKTGSKDLVKASGAGEIIKAGSVIELVNVLKNIVKDNSICEKWKDNTKKYKDLISDESIGNYVVDCIKYFTAETNKYPRCPWL